MQARLVAAVASAAVTNPFALPMTRPSLLRLL